MKMVGAAKVWVLLAAAAAVAAGEGGQGGRRRFLYGRRFELRRDAGEERRDELYSPLITNPIRALPSNSTDSEEEALQQNQNEILTSIRDFMRTTTEDNPRESHGEEATTVSAPEESPKVKSRQDGDRSLMVVLPFRAEGENVEELFTKRPLVEVIESDGEDGGRGTSPSPVTGERESSPTTEQSPVTRKRWRPSHAYRTTTETHSAETTTEAVKTYTNYDDVELVTRKFESPTAEPQNFPNHNYDSHFVTPDPIYRRFTAKTKKAQSESEEVSTSTEESAPPSSTEKPKDVKHKLRRKGQRRKPTTEGPPKPEELNKILDILPADVKDFILQMGLNKENTEEAAAQNNFRLERPSQPTIDPMSYAVFKPLPVEGHAENRNFVPDDMKDFLASFGLLPVRGRVQKSLKAEAPPRGDSPTDDLSGVNLDFLPDDLKSLLQDMGLLRSDSKKGPTRIHIFNPSNHSIAHSEEDFEKLNAILSSIKTTVNKSQSLTPEMQSEVIDKIRDLNNLRYKSANLSEINNEIKKIVVDGKNSSDTKLKVTAKRATKLNEGPDPVMLSEDSLLKNDVKRQSNSTNASSSSASSSASAAGDSSASSSSSASAAGDSSASSSSASAAGDSSASSSSSASAAGDTSASASASAASDGEAITTTEEGPNIEALKESFGGGETAPDDADIESSLPPKRPNGLYLLLDWNSFLEVGTDDDSRRVNLRFQPKIGDSRNFLPVSVP